MFAGTRSFPRDAFGYAGTKFQYTAGGSIILKMTRTQHAQRLYRFTGEGIYRDTVLLGQEASVVPPGAAPLLNSQVGRRKKQYGSQDKRKPALF